MNFFHKFVVDFKHNTMANINIPINIKGRRDRIYKYLELLYKFHHLTNKEMQLLVELIIINSDLVTNHGEDIASKLLFHKDNKIKIMKSLDGMTSPVFHNYLSNLRQKKVISGKSIVKTFIPPTEDFKVIISFING